MDDIDCQYYDMGEVRLGTQNNHASDITADAADGDGTFRIGEGVLQGHQSAPDQHNRAFQLDALEPWLATRRATPAGAALICSSPFCVNPVGLSTTVSMDDVARKVLGDTPQEIARGLAEASKQF
eukprot:5774399-Pyramimonas_sp.AAC.1